MPWQVQNKVLSRKRGKTALKTFPHEIQVKSENQKSLSGNIVR